MNGRLTSGIILLVYLDFGQGTYKKWLPTVATSRGGSWSGGRVPCHNDHVTFPTSTGPIAIQEDLTVMGMVLPSTGELILGEHVTLSFPVSTSQDDNCPGTDVRFLQPSASSWFDADNWCVTSHDGGDCMAVQPPSLHTEQIPCSGDAVTFVSDGAVLVDLKSGVDIRIGTLTIHNTRYTTDAFHDYLTTPAGREEFNRSSGSPRTTLTMGGAMCDDPEGCACHNDRGPILDLICSSVTCANVTCTDPVKPIGHCCEICGAILTMDYTEGFEFESLRRAVESLYVHQDGGDDVKLILSHGSADRIQIVIQDATSGQQAAMIAKKAKDMLVKDASNKNKYKVHDLIMTSSTASATPSTGKQTGASSSAQVYNILGIVFSVVLVVALIALGIFCFTDRRKRSFLPNFKRFGRRSEGDLELDSVAYDDSTVPKSDGFDNPMYATAQDVDIGVTPAGLQVLNVGALKKTDDNDNYNSAFANPMYGEDGPVQEIDHTEPVLLDPTLEVSVSATAESNI